MRSIKYKAYLGLWWPKTLQLITAALLANGICAMKCLLFLLKAQRNIATSPIIQIGYFYYCFQISQG